jgi:hypothetical protein
MMAALGQRQRQRALSMCLALSTCSACASGALFVDAPPVWQVDDERDIAEPKERPFDRSEYYAQIYFAERVDRELSLPTAEPAQNTNAYDEVPNSTWFQNRIGVRNVTPDEAATGPVRAGPPQPPFVIVGGKVGGGTPGFRLKDRSGRKFLVKFDAKQNPELHTAAGTIVGRIFWTLGYNVPADQVFELRRDQLQIEPGATYVNELKNKVPFEQAAVVGFLYDGRVGIYCF